MPDKLGHLFGREIRLHEVRIIVQPHIVGVFRYLRMRLHNPAEEPAHHEITVRPPQRFVQILLVSREVYLDELCYLGECAKFLVSVVLMKDENIGVGEQPPSNLN